MSLLSRAQSVTNAFGVKGKGRVNGGTLKLQDWTLTDEFAGLDIAGLDNDGRMCGQLTELKLQNFIP